MRKLTMTAALLLGACGDLPTEPPPPIATVPVYVVTQGNRGQGELRADLTAQLGLPGIRLGFDWPRIEPVEGEPTWEVQDRAVYAARQYRQDIIGMLGYSPEWARPEGTTTKHRPVINGSTSEGDQAFARFAAMCARRYPWITTWEIWNEPNIHFWVNGDEVGANPLDYMELFATARDSIKAANPAADVLLGGLAPGRGDQEMDEFLAGVFEMGFDGDGIAIHPYTAHPVAGRRNPWVWLIQQVLNLYDSNLPVYVTEWGVNHHRAEELGVSTYDWFRHGLLQLATDPTLRVVTIYALVHDERFALVLEDGTPTEQGRALLDVLGGTP